MDLRQASFVIIVLILVLFVFVGLYPSPFTITACSLLTVSLVPVQAMIILKDGSSAKDINE